MPELSYSTVCLPISAALIAVSRTTRTREYDRIIRANPSNAHINCFFALSSFSESAPPMTRLKPVITKIITVTGAAKYRSAPAMI